MSREQFSFYDELYQPKRLKASVSNLWTQQQQDFLIELYTKYGKSLTKLCQMLKVKFPYDTKQIFTVNRINSKIQTLMREGLEIYQKYMGWNQQIIRGFKSYPLSTLVNKVRSIKNQNYFDCKAYIVSLKRRKVYNQEKMKEITMMMYLVLDVPPQRRLAYHQLDFKALDENVKQTVKSSIRQKMRQWFLTQEQPQQQIEKPNIVQTNNVEMII